MNKEIEKAIEELQSLKSICLHAEDGQQPPMAAIELAKTYDLSITALEAQKDDAWILISSGVLPEDRGYPPVICCNKEDKWTDAAIVTTHGRFINCEGVIIRPTHWKPLPEPYKGVEEAAVDWKDKLLDKFTRRE